MADFNLPYIEWRDGRPRFKPGPRERRLGFQPKDLRHDDGRWLSLDEARTFAETKYAEILRQRAAGKRLPVQAPVRGRTLADLLDDWMASPAVTTRKPKTREGYAKCVEAIRHRPETRTQRAARIARERAAETLGLPVPERPRETFSRLPVAAIGLPELSDFVEYLRAERGHHMALACKAAISAAFSWGGRSTHWRLPANPFLHARFERPAPRLMIWTDAEVRAFLAAADALRRPSIGDALMLGLFTGQRQGDRLTFCDVGLVDGRRVFVQHKTATPVAIPETPQLRARLEAARARVATIKLAFGTRPAEVVVDETTGNAYNEHTYRHVFAEVRRVAQHGSNVHALAPCPSIEGKRDQDLRDTAVTWLARAGCTLPEICAITGHSLQSAHQVLKHYLALTPELADAGIGKLVAWFDRQGMRV